MKHKAAILVVEDERIIARDLQQTLLELGYDAWAVAASAEEALARAKERVPDLVLMDIRIKGELDGIQAAAQLEANFSVPVVFLTAHADEATLERAKATGPYGYLIKPVRTEELRIAIEIGLQRHQLEQRLREREQWFATTLRSIADAVIAVDLAGKVSFMNPAAEDLTGLTAAAASGKPVREVLRLTGWDESPLDRALREGRRVDLSDGQLLNLTSGAVRAISDSAAPVVDGSQRLGAVMVFRDVTEQRQLQQQLEVADRLASLGTMAAGVAHEVNNPLTVVTGNISLMRLDLGDLRAELAAWGAIAGDALARLSNIEAELADVEAAAHRIGRIVSDLRAFCRPPSTTSNRADVKRCLEWALRACSQELKHRARVVTEVGILPAVCLDETRLGQVFINLLVNAAQAIDPGHVEQNTITIRAQATPAGSVVIEVHDTGAGISSEALPRIFEPFFTTKMIGVGTGLGLSICHGIISGVGGSIEALSTPGCGTTMRVTLPAADAPMAVPATPQSSAPPVRGRILLIDDEPIVLRVLERILDEHDVRCMTDARAALELIDAGEHFDLIFADIMMPTMTGKELYEMLAARHPEACRRVVFLTGGPIGGTLEGFLRSVPNVTLCKPFDVGTLRETVQRLLRATPAEPGPLRVPA